MIWHGNNLDLHIKEREKIPATEQEKEMCLRYEAQTCIWRYRKRTRHLKITTIYSMTRYSMETNLLKHSFPYIFDYINRLWRANNLTYQHVKALNKHCSSLMFSFLFIFFFLVLILFCKDLNSIDDTWIVEL